MNNSILQAQCINMTELNHLFINLEYEKTQNKNIGVYRSRCYNQKHKKYLQLDEVKSALKAIDRTKLKYIYILGENAMLHPEFNQILRLCLLVKPVTIYTDGSCINDKKARFLKKVEDEGENEIVFKIFINHYDEKTNDQISGRGSYRKVIHSIVSLTKYGFNPILAIRCTQSDFEKQKENFCELGKKFTFETEDINFTLIPTTNVLDETNIHATEETIEKQFDCMHSRVLCKSGIYNCPSLINDYRGRAGADISDYSSKCYLESECCNICNNCGKRIYVNDWC